MRADVNGYGAWLAYLEELPFQGRSSSRHGTLDVDCWNAFLRGASLGIDSDVALREVNQRVDAAGEPLNETKRINQLKRAYAYISVHCQHDTSASTFQPRAKPQYNLERLQALADQLGQPADEEFFRLRSKFSLHNRPPAGILHKLYLPGEKVVVFNIFESQGCEVWEHQGPAGDLSTLDWLARDQANIWFLANPVDGLYHFNPRQNRFSRRSEESVTSFRYAVLESDCAPRQLWLNTIAQLPLPISSITDSGSGTSVHVILRIDASNKVEWTEIVKGELKAPLIVLGADLQTLSAVRLTRLGNCWRGEKDQLQRLLYLDDEPDDYPICEKALRDPDTLRAAWENRL
jgi:hypothetical protein